jgi:hypothetical protein
MRRKCQEERAAAIEWHRQLTRRKWPSRALYFSKKIVTHVGRYAACPQAINYQSTGRLNDLILFHRLRFFDWAAE